MKKIILVTCFLFLVTQSFVFADEIVDSKGNVTPCKILTVCDGFIQYEKDGNLYTFVRSENSSVFNDYVDVRLKLIKKDNFVRYSGKIVTKDMWGVILKNENGNVDIPFYRVKFVGVYRP